MALCHPVSVHEPFVGVDQLVEGDGPADLGEEVGEKVTSGWAGF